MPKALLSRVLDEAIILEHWSTMQQCEQRESNPVRVSERNRPALTVTEHATTELSAPQLIRLRK